MFTRSPHGTRTRRWAQMLVVVTGMALAGTAVGAAIPTAASAATTHAKPGLGRLNPTHIIPARPSSSTSGVLPASVDLSRWAPPVGNQGSVGSCVTWAIDYGLLGWQASYEAHAGAPFAPMYTYSQIHYTDANGDDIGSFASDPIGRRGALEVAKDQGTDTRAHYVPQGDYDWRTQPTASQRTNAANHKISSFKTWFMSNTGQGDRGVQLIKEALASGRPVSIGMDVRNNFTDHFWYRTSSTMLYDDITSNVEGGHEMMAIGYDADGLLVQNSWGTDWGYQGRVRLSWRVVAHDVEEAFTVNSLATSTNPAPAMGTVKRAVASGYQVGSTVPVKVSWSATDSDGIGAYKVWTQTNGGTWTDTTSRLSSATATSVVLSLTPGSTYRFAVQAKDTRGAWSTFAYTSTFTPRVYDDNYVGFSAGWSRYTWPSSYGGTARSTATAGSTASFRFTGAGVAWVAPKTTSRGKASVYVDGSYFTTVDLYSATLSARPAVLSLYWGSSGTHTVSIKALGTTGRPTVDIDAFAVLS